MEQQDQPNSTPQVPTQQNPYEHSEASMQQQMAQQPQRLGDDVGMRILLPVGRSGLAIAAGYLGLLSVTLVIAPIAILVSILAIRDINKSKHSETPKHGMGRAIFGLIMGVIGSVVLAIVVKDEFFW